MAVKVDPKKCIGCGACVVACPEGFEMKNGVSVFKKNAPCLKDAQNSCPVDAISGA
jgi:ferredoxin